MSRETRDDKITNAKLEIAKDEAVLGKALAAKLHKGNTVAWAEEVEGALYWIETDTAAYVRLVRDQARARLAAVMLPEAA